MSAVGKYPIHGQIGTGGLGGESGGGGGETNFGLNQGAQPPGQNVYDGKVGAALKFRRMAGDVEADTLLPGKAYYVHNETAGTLLAWRAVQAPTVDTGDVYNAAYLDPSIQAHRENYRGILAEDIAPGAYGWAIKDASIGGGDSSLWSELDNLYVGATDGQLTNTDPGDDTSLRVAQAKRVDTGTAGIIDAIPPGGGSAGTADAMVWRGEWAAGEYVENDTVRDGAWTSIANATTTDRPAPQPTADPFWVYTGTAANASATAKVITSGQRYLAVGDGYLGGYRINVVAGNRYEVLYVADPDGAAEVTLLNIFDATVSGWREFGLLPIFVKSGTKFDLLLQVTQPDPVPTTFSGNWNYARSNTAPVAGQVTHNSNNTTMRIAFVDNDTTDQTVNLSGLDVGDKISISGSIWSIQTVTVNAGDLQVEVAPAYRASAGLYAFTLHTGAAPHTPASRACLPSTAALMRS
jgi:hypothetical protein